MAGIFGTDGIRGKADTPPIDARTIYLAARAYAANRAGSQILLAMDTRESSKRIAAWITSGVRDGGATVVPLGVAPTPVLAFGTCLADFSGGIMITASHNPYMDNGVKFFNGRGTKISDDEEDRITQAAHADDPVPDHFQSDETNSLSNRQDLFAQYWASLSSAVPGIGSLPALLPLDCANGAGVTLVEFIRTVGGLPLSSRNDAPDGVNINRNCGAAQPDALLPGSGALDGDGDRILLKDKHGRLLSGDHILLYLCEMQKTPGIIGTVMTNQAVAAYCNRHQLVFHRTDVGDRHVRNTMNETGIPLGGETSGHIIFDPLNHTGDGLAVFLLLQQLMVEHNHTLEEIYDRYPMMPQTLLNVNVARRIPLDEIPGLIDLMGQLEPKVKAADGRLFPRYSGTENLLRFLIESLDEDLNREIAGQLEKFFHTRRT